MKPKLTKQQKQELIKKFGHIPTKEEIFEKIKASQERMMQALTGALETAPKNPKVRGQLLEAVEKATKLRQKIYQDLLKEKPSAVKVPPKPENNTED